MSRSLSKAEKIYTTTEKECLAVLYCIETARPCIEGTKFTVITDHYSLIWLKELQAPSGRLGRWTVKLQQGKERIVSNTLSRSVPEIVSVEEKDIKDKWYTALKGKIKRNAKKYPQYRIQDDFFYKYVK